MRRLIFSWLAEGVSSAIVVRGSTPEDQAGCRDVTCS